MLLMCSANAGVVVFETGCRERACARVAGAVWPGAERAWAGAFRLTVMVRRKAFAALDSGNEEQHARHYI